MAANSEPHRTILVTGAGGFIGRNLVALLRRDSRVVLREYGRGSDDLEAACSGADVVVHLAGENRPDDPAAFDEVNVGLTRYLVEALRRTGRAVPLLYASSAQASLDNPYGRSKRRAEDEILAYGTETGAAVAVIRLPNVFGKWSRPHYNSVVATFCHNAVRGVPLSVDDPDHVLQLVHIDDVVREFARWAFDPIDAGASMQVTPTKDITVGELAELIESYVGSRSSRVLPDLASPFSRALYGTLASFYELDDLAVPANVHVDARGWLFEVVKSAHAGQVFMSSTRPGYSRGDHWHDTKVEKFTVVQGRGSILFRQVFSDEVIVYEVSGEDIRSVDIPTGYVHSIRNDGDVDLLVLFWASAILDPEHPDTHYERVLPSGHDE